VGDDVDLPEVMGRATNARIAPALTTLSWPGRAIA
jgi:hypothetical protein